MPVLFHLSQRWLYLCTSRPGSLVFLQLFSIFSRSSLSCWLFFLLTTVALLLLTLGPLTTWSLTSLASSATSSSWVCQFEWETTPMFQSWVMVWPSLPSMANVSWSAMYCMSQVGSSALQPLYPHHSAGLWIHWHQGNWILGVLPYLGPLHQHCQGLPSLLQSSWHLCSIGYPPLHPTMMSSGCLPL
jgi:hypothetical protein